MRVSVLCFIASVAFLGAVALESFAQTQQTQSKPIPVATQKLKVVSRIDTPRDFAQNIVGFPTCDADGNVYFSTAYDANSAIRKFNLNGEEVALFRTGSITDLKVDFPWNFDVSADGYVYQILYLQNTGKRYVAVFEKDGSYKSSVRLDAGYEITTVSQAAPFPSGQLIVTGLTTHGDPTTTVKTPFTGIFAANGVLLKEISLSDDKAIHDMAANGDPRVVDKPGAGTNSAIERGALSVGPDGNAYIMRRLSPAIIYVVSAGGEVIRRFTVTAGEGKENYMPADMHVSPRGIAVLFHESLTNNQVIKVVDLEGHHLASYEDERVGGKLSLGISFACYLDSPERFVFLGQSDDRKLQFRIAEPQ